MLVVGLKRWPFYPWERNPVAIVQEAEWVSGLARKIRPNHHSNLEKKGISIKEALWRGGEILNDFVMYFMYFILYCIVFLL
jgi:hypothetical protein